ncbi:tetratricopeptide repeat protein [Polyangium sp. 15x6]|uniref:tetratricopeptide repeat protein n=1 Tax=Polyangium sp. 15x6 TaxID=3042687 RepID=UPI00249A2F1F|nr:tetratricopeptide repeat protein [Polyangium sp. 15x6]MDI3288794.1 tetratricopeptide repeat protein [Polyangium sp. 15x6]
MPPEPSPASPPRVAIETEQRLSRSLLWTLQRRYFEEAGVSAWSTSTVPHYVTNNPAIAHAYAAVFFGFLRDCAPTLHPAEPLTIVELGAGSGRFAHFFLRALTDMLRRSPLAGKKIRYVMTDFTESNVRFWQTQPSLRPFVDQGILDFALFDAEQDHELRLLHAGVTLSPGALRNPVGIIANYIFDGIRQDAFSFAGGQMQERLVSLTAPEPAPDPTRPDLLRTLEVSFTERPAPLDYYGEPALDAILRGYAARLDGATLLFPCAAIRCVGRLADLSGGRMLLLSGDRGDSHEEALAQDEHLGLAVHGSFSLEVNYHALAEYVAGRGGRTLRHAHRHAHVCMTAFLLGEHPSAYAETAFAYEEAIERAGPDDAYALCRQLRANVESMDLTHVLSLLRASRWDPRTLLDGLPVLWRHQPTASGADAREVVFAVMRAWDSYCFIGEEQDLAFELGLLLHGYGAHREAIALFEASARNHGDEARVRWNVGLCHYALGEVERALGCFREAARLDPAFIPAGAAQMRQAESG